jgi:formylglycine-generating enzyme required for sulfatase activity
MADVFLSYRNTPERRAFVKRLALLLRAHEVTVWWDYGLEAGESYRAQITEELSKARIVAPLWCAESIQSKWVAMEAELGKDKLVPARLQKVVPPEAFEAIQAADLIGWDGAVDHARALAFVRKICERLGKPSNAPIDMMEELADLRPLTPLPEVGVAATVSAAPGQDAVLADLRATWERFPARDDSSAVERFLARVRGTAPGSGLEFEVEHALDVMRAETQRREKAQRAAEEAARRDAEEKAAAAAEEQRRSTPGAEFRDGEGLPLMVTIPAGTFRMGSLDNEKDRLDSEGPVREVRIAQPLAVGKYPVTVGEFRRFIEATGHDTGSSANIWTGFEWEDTPGRGWRSPGFAQDDTHPVTCVNWHDAVAYAEWIAKVTGRPYRLLSESEWEYACRAGTQTRYAFGDEISTDKANFNNAKGGTTPVGAYPANVFKLHDMHSNVWDWCQDCWNANYNGAPTDGSARTTGDCSLRVLRGGSWYNDPQKFRSAFRLGGDPTNRSSVTGFRLARDL